MPGQDPTVAIVVGGTSYQNWVSAMVTVVFGQTDREFQFQAVEVLDATGGSSMAAMQIKPGSDCQIMFGGQLAFTGFVVDRITSYDANKHDVLLKGRGKNYDVNRASATDMKGGGQKRGYPLVTLANYLMKPIGRTLQLRNASGNANAPFKNFQINPGEKIRHAIDRLARGRGVSFVEDAQGQLWGVGDQGGGGGGDQLVEGKNILRGQSTISTWYKHSNVDMSGQNQGDDQAHGKKASQVSAHSTGSGTGGKQFHSEIPTDQQGAITRTNYENMWDNSFEIQAEIVVYGWTNSSGQLWDVYGANTSGGSATVSSPMLMLQQSLDIDRVTLMLDPNEGSLTVIHLTNRLSQTGQDLSGSGTNSNSSSDNQTSQPPTQQEAQPGPSQGEIDPNPNVASGI